MAGSKGAAGAMDEPQVSHPGLVECGLRRAPEADDDLARFGQRPHAGQGSRVDPALALTALGEGDNPLTPREREVLAAAVDGAAIADIAARMALSEGTVRNHLSVAIQKLGARNGVEAARVAEQKGWL